MKNLLGIIKRTARKLQRSRTERRERLGRMELREYLWSMDTEERLETIRIVKEFEKDE